jgi:hypothetical protein
MITDSLSGWIRYGYLRDHQGKNAIRFTLTFSDYQLSPFPASPSPPFTPSPIPSLSLLLTDSLLAFFLLIAQLQFGLDKVTIVCKIRSIE